jgi:hypothetical protein
LQGNDPKKKKKKKYKDLGLIIKNICEQFHSRSTEQFLKGIAQNILT